MSFLDKLGIEWKLLLAQLVNFTILLFVLYRFLYKPILIVLEHRRRQIEENIEKTKELEARLREAETAYEEKMRKAERKSLALIQEAEATAREMKNDILEHARSEAEAILKEAGARAAAEKQKIMEEIKLESVAFVKEAVRSVLGSIGDNETTKILMEKALKELKRKEA